VKSQILLLLLILSADISSALGVVYTRHQSRRLAVELGALETLHDSAVADWSRLQIEQAWLADANQIEITARQRLQMRAPEKTTILEIEQ
jgi:cell division protein FtsL